MRNDEPGRAVLFVFNALLCGLALLLPGAGHAQTFAPQDAAQHVGQMATVCGVVASARFSVQSRGQPTFLNLDQPYPAQVFTVVIWGDERPRFGAPEVAYASRRVCATARIEMYRGKPEMILNDPAQLRLDNGQTGPATPPPSRLRPALSE
jgi:hypothetical protein